MPKVPNYNNSVIYKIQHQERPELIYVGSTTDFIMRKAIHRCTCNNSNHIQHNLKVYQMIRDNEGWDAFKIIIVKEFPCASKVELLIEEDKTMIELKASLNCYKAYRTDEELKEYTKQYTKQYREANKISLLKQNKEWRDANKDKIKERMKQYNEINKEKIKKYRQASKENRQKYDKQYQQINKDKRNAQRKTRRQELKQAKEKPIDI